MNCDYCQYYRDERRTVCPHCDNNLVLGAARPSEEIVPPPAAGYAPERPRTMREREGAAEEAMWRDIERKRAEYAIVMIEKRFIPAGAELVEAYETESEWWVVGEPWRGDDVNDPRYHDCDEMGCATLCHVVARIQKPKGHIEKSSDAMEETK